MNCSAQKLLKKREELTVVSLRFQRWKKLSYCILPSGLLKPRCVRRDVALLDSVGSYKNSPKNRTNDRTFSRSSSISSVINSLQSENQNLSSILLNKLQAQQTHKDLHEYLHRQRCISFTLRLYDHYRLNYYLRQQRMDYILQGSYYVYRKVLEYYFELQPVEQIFEQKYSQKSLSEL